MGTTVSRLAAVAIILSATAGCGATTSPSSAPPTDTPSVTAISTPAASTSGGSPTASTGASPVPSEGPIPAGTYRVDPGPFTAVGYTVDIPEGWVAQNGGQTLSKHPDEPGEVGINPFVVQDVFADACGPNDPLKVGPTATDLVTALQQQAGPETSDPTAVTLGGHPATSLRLTIPDGLDPSTCDPPIGLQIWHSGPADNYYGRDRWRNRDRDDGRREWRATRAHHAGGVRVDSRRHRRDGGDRRLGPHPAVT